MVTYHISAITNKLNQEVGSSWAHSPYSLCNERRNKAKVLNNPTATYKKPEQVMHRVYPVLPSL